MVAAATKATKCLIQMEKNIRELRRKVLLHTIMNDIPCIYFRYLIILRKFVLY